MNHYFKEKTKVIQAFQMTEERRRDNTDWPEWLNRAWQASIVYPYVQKSTVSFFVKALDGVYFIPPDNWITIDEDGDIDTYSPEAFEAKYEPAEPPTT